MRKLNRLQRCALADAYAAANRKGLRSAGTWWHDPVIPASAYHHPATIRSLVERGLLQLYVNGTVAHVTEFGARRHEELLERGQ